MSENIVNSKRIAKNTLMLYIRMLFLMLINLYTSRVVLEALGVEDYGLYNAVAGFIAMFSMVSASISGSISRFITFVLGQNDPSKLKRVFSTALIIQIAIAALVILLVELFGVWFLNTKMVIPNGRYFAANFVLQFSLLTFVLNLWSTPYNAALIAHEKMSAFAFIGVFEGLANLSVALLIQIFDGDSLILYAALMCMVSLIIRITYSVYCKRNFEECSFRLIFDRNLFAEMFSFAGWNFIGIMSGLLREQGLNLLFNIYFGPVVNAARGLATQVNTAVGKFSSNFLTAVQPQITKSVASNHLDDANNLVLRSSRLSFLLMMVFVIPIVTEADFLLSIWLKEVPLHTIEFVQIIMLFSLFESFSLPLIYLMLATGKIKKYQLVVGSINLLNFPIAWIILHFGGSPEYAQLSVLFFSFIILALRVFMLRPLTGFPIVRFFKSTVLRCLIIFICSALPSLYFSQSMGVGIVRFCISVSISEILILIVSFVFGLDLKEREYIINKIKSITK